MSEAKIHAVVEPPVPTEAAVYLSTAKPKPPLTEEEWANLEKPKVLIVGAGIGGLMLGNFLEKGGIPYAIYERAKEVKPLGRPFAFSPKPISSCPHFIMLTIAVIVYHSTRIRHGFGIHIRAIVPAKLVLQLTKLYVVRVCVFIFGLQLSFLPSSRHSRRS